MSKKRPKYGAGSGLRYVKGAGVSILNVPARDLSPDEAERFWPIIQEQEAASGHTIYEPTEAQAADDISTMIATPETSGDTVLIDVSAEADKEN